MHQKTIDKLLQKQTRPTSMRILLYNYLVEQQQALSLSEIEAAFEQVDRITLYRNLKTFEEKGLVHSIQEQNTTRYILCADDCDEKTHRDRHLHLYCRLCKQTSCHYDIQLTNTVFPGIQLDEIRFFAKGLCASCLQQLQ